MPSVFNGIRDAAELTPSQFTQNIFSLVEASEAHQKNPYAAVPVVVTDDLLELSNVINAVSLAGVLQDPYAAIPIRGRRDPLKALYANIEAYFICDNDRIDGIKTRKLTTEAEFNEHVLQDIWTQSSTKVLYYRDATGRSAKAPANDPRLERNDFMLRSLNVVRGIDHALQEMGKRTGEAEYFNGLRAHLAGRYQDLLKNYQLLSNGFSIADLEKNFNYFMAYILHEGHLDYGVEDVADKDLKKFYESLLSNYRFLAGTLEPAAGMVVDFKDQNQGGMTFREIALPVTTKTNAQKHAFEQMREFPADWPSWDQNFHRAQSPSIQLAQSLFTDRVKADDSILGPQLRKTIAPGAKNAYITTFEVRFKGEQLKKYHFARSGSFVYMGDGEDHQLQPYAQENLEQLREAAKALGFDSDRFHSTILNTPIGWDKEDLLVTVTTEALVARGDYCSNVPVNVYGLLYSVKVAPELEKEIEDVFSRIFKADTALEARFKSWGKRTRGMFLAAVVSLAASQTPGVLSIYSCFSGQDRTGFQSDMVTTLAMQHASQEVDKSLEFEAARDLKMQGLSSPFMATLANPGSTGIKNGSVNEELAGKEHAKKLQPKRALTAKKAPIVEETDSLVAIARRKRLFELKVGQHVASVPAPDQPPARAPGSDLDSGLASESASVRQEGSPSRISVADDRTVHSQVVSAADRGNVRGRPVILTSSPVKSDWSLNLKPIDFIRRKLLDYLDLAHARGFNDGSVFNETGKRDDSQRRPQKMVYESGLTFFSTNLSRIKYDSAYQLLSELNSLISGDSNQRLTGAVSVEELTLLKTRLETLKQYVEKVTDEANKASAFSFFGLNRHGRGELHKSVVDCLKHVEEALVICQGPKARVDNPEQGASSVVPRGR